MTWVLGVTVWLFGVLTTLVLRILLTEPLQYALARLLGPLVPSRPRGVKGIWRSEYQFPSHGARRTGTQLMKLKQVGPWVIGTCIIGDPHEHQIRGRLLKGMYFTGVWKNAQKDRVWHGAFQVVLHPEGGQMKGKWIGFDSENRVASGDWEWTRLSRLVSKDSVAEALENWGTDERSTTGDS